ncbi:MAG: sulfatase-like hydrolase/transferase [Candidatus Diapherotrites archaeon]|nr:sulfatase-like hydrolase/transferase [Candidatus Diapherotrites archaeon]
MPNVVFVLVDCANLDAFLGKTNAKTPFLDRLRKESTVFTQAVSVSSMTNACAASVLTGTHRFKHNVATGGEEALSRDVKTLAEAFKEKSYWTVAEATGSLLKEVGFDRGFDDYNFRDCSKTIYSAWGEGFFKKLALLKKGPPFFLLLHLMELHRPRYMTKEFNKAKYGKTAYEKSLSCLDRYLEKIFMVLDLTGETLFVLTADHGEKVPQNKVEEYLNQLFIASYAILRKLKFSKKYFSGESHGTDLGETVIRVPLLFQGKMFPKGKVIGPQVAQVDIPLTIADAVNISLGKETDGQSLMPLVRGEPLNERAAFIEERGIKLQRSEWIEGVRTSKWKFVQGIFNQQLPELLFDLEKDPLEKNNLAKERPEKEKEMKAMLSALKRNAQGRTTPTKTLSQEQKARVEEELRRIGYL